MPCCSPIKNMMMRSSIKNILLLSPEKARRKTRTFQFLLLFCPKKGRRTPPCNNLNHLAVQPREKAKTGEKNYPANDD